MVSLQAKPDLPAKPKSFAFPEPNVETSESVYQRYVDADLATVKANVDLQEKYGKTSYAWLIYPIIGAVLVGLLFLGLLIYMLTRPKKEKKKSRFNLDEDLSPFAAISLLQEIHADRGLSEKKKDELALTIDRLESHFFGDSQEPADPDLQGEVKKWAKQTRLAF